MATPAWHPAPSFSADTAGARQAAPRLCAESAPGRHYTAVGRGRRWEFRRRSRRRPRRGGDSRPQSVLCSSSLPPGAGTNGLAAAEVISQAKPGVRLGGAPRARAFLGPRVGRSQLEHPSRWLLVLGLSFRSVQLVKSCLSCAPLGLPVGLEI